MAREKITAQNFNPDKFNSYDLGKADKKELVKIIFRLALNPPTVNVAGDRRRI